MRDLDSVICYAGTLPKPTRCNSIVISNRVISIIKKDYEGKSINMFSAYDYKSGKLLHSDFTKEDLISFLVKEDKAIASTFGTTNQTLF